MSNFSTTKSEVKTWWEEHPMDYLDYSKVGEFESEAEAKEFFKMIDANFYERTWYAQEMGANLFSNLIDYDVLRGKRVLEIGCGLGAISAELAKQGANVSVVDLTSTSVNITQKRFLQLGLDGNFIQADAENLPFKSETFDFVWSWGVIHHSPNTLQAIKEIHRVIKKGEISSVMVYHKHSLYNYLNVTLRYGILKLELLKRPYQKLLSKYSDGKHVGGCPLAQYFSKKEAQEMFSMYEGISITAFGPKEGIVNIFPNIFRVREFLTRTIPDSFFAFIFRRFGVHLFIQAEK